jgi:hypothetical protein
MVHISRDSDGKTRVAKGDRTGLGGQYAPDPVKLDAAKKRVEELQDTLFDLEEKTIYEVWYTTYTYENGVLPYAPVFDNKAEADEWVKDFYATNDSPDEIKRLEVVGSKRNPDGSFAGYVEEDYSLPSVKVEDEPVEELQDSNCTMSLEEMIALVKEEWSDAMSDDGRIWAKTNEKLKKAITECPELHKQAVDIARAETLESYKKAGLI